MVAPKEMIAVEVIQQVHRLIERHRKQWLDDAMATLPKLRVKQHRSIYDDHKPAW